MSKAAVVMDQTYAPFKEGYPEELNFQSLLKATDKLAYTRAGMILTPTRKRWQQLREKALYLRKHTDKIIVFQPTFPVFQGTHAFRGMDKFLVDVIRKPKIVEKFVSLLLEFYLAALRPITKNLGDVIDIFILGDDLGENNGPMLNPRLYRKYFKYAHEEMFSYIKKNSKSKVFFHSCGSIVPLIPDLIECGVDILNPIQINARNMDPKFLKENFGDDIVFWGGGVDTRKLPRMNPEEVKKHVTELLEIFAPGGGYVWNAIHNLQADVPPENIIAMLEAVNEYSYKN
jgi:uroporphyrinogen decarboxylase